MRWRISCQEQVLVGETLQDKWEFALECGFDGIELRGKGNFDFEARLPELRKAQADGVVMPSVCVDMRHFIGAFDDSLRQDAIQQMCSQLSVIAEIEGELAMTPASYGMFSRRLSRNEPPRSPEEDRTVLLEALNVLGEHARSLGVLICLEPLNRYEDHMVNTIEQAVELCRETQLPSVRVAADTYHMNIEEMDPAASLLKAQGWLGHVQVSDSNRLEPGAGHIDWSTMLAALDAASYTGWLAFEGRLSGPAELVLPATVSRLRQASQ
ncbi:MAG TPA: sugar phosphate isomerase/epimerase family protein [Actinomycetes bacterium]|nr:sugar phosphate isomerase/epimerase family protein [Actinomycetes bacterium]